MRRILVAAAIIFGAIAAFFAAFRKGEKAKEAEITSELLDVSKKSSDAANQEIIGGMKKQQAIKDEDRDPDRPRDILQ